MRLIRSLRTRLRGLSKESTQEPSRLIVGLGNPGPKYESTRHNIGFRVVERLADRAGGRWTMDPSLDARVASVVLEGVVCLLVEPQTFMNRSGRSLVAARDRWPALDPATDFLVIYDDLDLPTGRIRLRPSGGGGGHRGIGNIIDELETRDVPRLRFGVGHPGSSAAVIDWVLTAFSADEEVAVAEAVGRAAAAVEAALRDGLPVAMGQFNRDP